MRILMAAGSLVVSLGATAVVEFFVLAAIVRAQNAELEAAGVPPDAFTGTHSDLIAWALLIFIVVFPLALTLSWLAILKWGRRLAISTLAAGAAVTALYVGALELKSYAVFQVLYAGVLPWSLAASDAPGFWFAMGRADAFVPLGLATWSAAVFLLAFALTYAVGRARREGRRPAG